MNNVVAHVPAPSEGRQQPRTHLFVSAMLYADGGSVPVHIRNMSGSGVLVESAELPEVGCRIALKRGPLHATGHIAWRAGRRAGLRLDAPLYIPDWMSRQVSAGQARVDSMITSFRNGLAGDGLLPEKGKPPSLEVELATLRSELAALGSSLIGDTIVAATHPEIQAIDISLQRIDRMVGMLRAGG